MKLKLHIGLLAATSLLFANIGCACAHAGQAETAETHAGHDAHASHAGHHPASGEAGESHDCDDLLCDHSVALCADCTASVSLSLTSKSDTPSVDADASDWSPPALASLPWRLERPFRLPWVLSLGLGETAPALVTVRTLVSDRDQLIE